MILLTKSANTRYLEEIALAHWHALAVSFSPNPQPVADLWEGEWTDTQERIPPTIAQRLEEGRGCERSPPVSSTFALIASNE